MITPRRANVALAILLLVQMVNIADRELVHILLDEIRADIGASDTQMGLLTGLAFSLFYVIAGIPLARLADRVNRRNLLAACVAVWSAATMLCAPVATYWQLLLARIGVASGEAAAGPTAQSILADLFPREKRTRAVGFFFAGASAGHFAGLYLGGLIGSEFGWRTAFVCFGVFGIALASVIWLAVPEPRRGAHEPHSDAASPPPLGEALRLLFGMRTFTLLLVAFTIMSVTNYARLTWVPTFLIRTHEMSMAQVGFWVGVVSSVGSAVGNIFSGFFTDRLIRRSAAWYALVPGLALLIATPLMLVFAFAPGPTLALAALLPTAFLMGAAFTPPSALVLALATPRTRATAVAISVFATTLVGGGVGPLMVGALNDGLAPDFGRDAIRYSFIAIPVLYVAAAAFYLVCSRHVTRDLDLRSSARSSSEPAG